MTEWGPWECARGSSNPQEPAAQDTLAIMAERDLLRAKVAELEAALERVRSGKLAAPGTEGSE